MPRGHVLCGVPLYNNRPVFYGVIRWRDLSDLTLYHAISLEVRYAFDEHDKIGSGFLHNLQQNNLFRYKFYVLRPLCPKGHGISNLWVIIY